MVASGLRLLVEGLRVTVGVVRVAAPSLGLLLQEQPVVKGANDPCRSIQVFGRPKTLNPNTLSSQQTLHRRFVLARREAKNPKPFLLRTVDYNYGGGYGPGGPP